MSIVASSRLAISLPDKIEKDAGIAILFKSNVFFVVDSVINYMPC